MIRRSCAFGPALLLVAALTLPGCGGGGSDPPPAQSPPPPVIESFVAEKGTYAPGEAAMLTVRFSGGVGRIEPRIGEVASGTPIRTFALAGPQTFTLTVTSAGGTVSRTLDLAVEYRNRYQPVADRFAAYGHSATSTPHGIVLIGGWRGGNAPSTAIDLFDPATQRVRRLGSLHVAREGHSATLLEDGRILVVGGDAWIAGPPTAEVVDPGTGVSSLLMTPGVARTEHSATRLPGGHVLIAGGLSSGEAAPLSISRSAEIWDARTGQLRPLPARLGAARAAHGAATLRDGRVLLVGGASPRDDYALAEIFDPLTETFTALATTERRARFGHATAPLPDGSLLMLGGETNEPALQAGVLRFHADGTGAESLAALLRPRARAGHAVGVDGRVYLFGGELEAGRATATAEAYSAAHGAVEIAPLPEPRWAHTVTRLPDGRLLIAGGENETTWLLPTLLIYE